MDTIIKHNYELVAKRWAKALMDLACEDDGISKEDILDDLKEITANINSSNELSNVIVNPSISLEEKQIVLCKLFQNKILPIVYNFLYVLNLKKRINLISAIAIEFQQELEKIKNILRISITSAIELSDDKKIEIKEKISHKLHKEIIVEWDVNPDIIAGLIFKINDSIIDNSVKHKLECLSKEMVKG